MRYLKAIYLTWFVLFYRFAREAWTPDLNAWKGVIAITLIEWTVIVGLDSWLHLLTGVELILGLARGGIVLAGVLLFLANYFWLVKREHGITYEREFSTFNRSKKIRSVTISVAVMLTFIAFFITSGLAHRRAVKSGNADAPQSNASNARPEVPK